MLLRLISFFFCFFFISTATADTNVTAKDESSYIDDSHKVISGKVVEYSEHIDRTLSGWLGDDEEDNATVTGTTIIEPTLEDEAESVDAFFQNEKFLKETDDTFVRIRMDANFQSKEPEDFNLKVRAQLPLSRSKKKFKLFVDNVNQDNAKDIVSDDSDAERTAPEIGVHYFAPETYGIESKYSVGLSGIYPFVRARYNKIYETGVWLIEPTQSFKYSAKDDFQEETNIYFDTQLEELTLFRIQLHRKTRSRIDGMDYSLGFSYFWSPKKETGLNLTQSFWGNTKYKYIIDESTVPVTESGTYAGISNYSTSLGWRQSVWRKWFFYEMRPGVNFHRAYDYEANYTLRVYLDFYFGNRL